MAKSKPATSDAKPTELEQAAALWQARRFDDAIGKYEDAVRAAPNDFRTLIEASRALAFRYQIASSRALLEKAASLGRDRPEILHAVGESYRIMGRPVEAEFHFRAASQLATHPRTLLELAQLAERRHGLDEAYDLTVRALHIDSSLIQARLLQARIQRRRGEIAAAQASLQRLAKSSAATDPRQLAEVHGEWSALLDSVGDYNGAWDAIERAKAIQQTQQQVAWHAAQFVTARFRKSVEQLTADHFAGWKSDAAAEPPANLAILTGFPRSGTTLLEQVLDAHPAIVSVEEREVFSDEALLWLAAGRPPEAPMLEVLQDQSPQRIFEARAKYLRAMESLVGSPLNDRLLIDKNPALNLLLPAVRRVFPEAKFIVALRDPRDVVVSCFLRWMPVNPVSVWFMTLQRTVERYLIDMSGWLKLRGITGDWIEVRYEETVADLPARAKSMIDFLQIPWDDSVLNYRNRPETCQVRSPSYEAVVKPLFATSIGRWKNYERQLAPVLEKLAPITSALGYPE